MHYVTEHAVSHPITLVNRRPGSFPGSDPSTVLSPRSSEAGVLGVNMVEYVLGGSPVGKEFRGMKPFVSDQLYTSISNSRFYCIFSL